MFGRSSALCLTLLAHACAPAAKPAEEPSATTEVAASGGSETPVASSGSESAASNGTAAAADVDAAPAEPSAFDVCGQMCDRMQQRCSESAAKSCRLNCKQYQKLKAGCDPDARAALECARDAKDLQCAAIAPMSCNPAFQRFDACTRGEKLEEKAEVSKTPQGWERFTAQSPKFSALMPRGVSEKAEGGEPTFTVEDGKLIYSVRVKKAPDQKPTQKTLVKVALDMLGVNCSKNLRLHGMIETPQRVSIRFDSECKNGTQWRGQFVIGEGRLYVLAVTGPDAHKAEFEPFFSSFTSG